MERRHGRVVQRKDHTKRNRILSNIILGIGLYAVGMPLLNHEIAGRVLRVVAGERLTCPPAMIDSSTIGNQYDVEVILGAGMRLDEDGNWVANSFENERLYTGAGLVVAGYLEPGAKIVLLDGRLPEGADPMADATNFMRKVKEISYNTTSISPYKMIPNNDVDLVNTRTGMIAFSKLVHKNNWKRMLFITHEIHKNRALEDLIELGFCPTFITVEDYTYMFNSAYIEQLEKHTSSAGAKDREWKEGLGLFLHMYPPAMFINDQLKEWNTE